MLNSKPEQFKLAEDGQILWQKQAGNPMPGEPVARAVKGEHILKPGVEVIQSDIVADLDKAAVRDFIRVGCPVKPRELLINCMNLWALLHVKM
jgi:ATP-dependent RNA helicase SUPV3L1/SUV3